MSSWVEYQSLPVNMKRWLVGRLNEEFNKNKENDEPPVRGAHNNTPDIRALTNKARQQVPARLQRFS